MGIDVLTNRYNNARTGANLNETLLNQSNVNVNDFGKLFARGVDGQIYAQPLIVSDLDIRELGKRSIVIVATTRNMVYAFDAENAEACHPIWRVDCDGKFGTPVLHSDYGLGYNDFTSEIGITSTPVIDRQSGILYLTAKSKETKDNRPHYFYRLHALDIATGNGKLGSPVTIAETMVNDPQFVGNGKRVSSEADRLHLHQRAESKGHRHGFNRRNDQFQCLLRASASRSANAGRCALSGLRLAGGYRRLPWLGAGP